MELGASAGSGFGQKLTEQILQVGKEIADLGIKDPDLFPALGLLEQDIGADRISDMTTNVIFPALIAFNQRVVKQLDLVDELEEFVIAGKYGHFLPNPFEVDTPVILVPSDILRVLPVANDWDEIAHTASLTQALRDRVNEHIGHIFAKHDERNPKFLKRQALVSKQAFDVLLDTVHSVLPEPYQVGMDPDGRIHWARIGNEVAAKFPLDLTNISVKTTDGSDKYYCGDYYQTVSLLNRAKRPLEGTLRKQW